MGTLKPRSLGEVARCFGVGGVIQFEFLPIGTRGALGENGVGDETSKYLSHPDGIRDWLHMVGTGGGVNGLLCWCSTVTTPKVGGSGISQHFNDQPLQLMTETLGKARRFAAAKSP